MSLIEDYLDDQDYGMRKIHTWFLSFVMEQEALHQANAQQYDRIDSEKSIL
jgi:putative transposase